MNHRLTRCADMINPSQYVEALNGKFASWALNEERAPQFRGRWRSDVFRVKEPHPLDLEIGTGNGFFFAHHALAHPERAVVGIELKFKPLIQSIRRAVNAGAVNARILRFHASQMDELFVAGELNDVFIFFPDPWPRQRSFKHRLIQDDFLKRLFQLQRPGSKVVFKTDHVGYYEWALERFQRSEYQVEAVTDHLHASEHAKDNFMTQFERLWTSKGLPTHYIRAVRP